MMEAMDRASIYDRDIPSLSASLEAFEAFDPERRALSRLHSSQFSARSGLQSSSRWSANDADQDVDAQSEAESEGPWAPPAWQRSNNHWYRKSLLGGHSDSISHLRATNSPSKSPARYFDRADRDITPSRIPLPESPLKMTPRTSPEPVDVHEHRGALHPNIAERMQSPSVEPHAGGGSQEGAQDSLALSHHEEAPGHLDGFVRFAIRGETLFRTAPLEDIMTSFARAVHFFTRSKLTIFYTVTTIFVAYLLTIPWNESLIPDIANVANIAKQFEPLMYGSENVIPRSRELAEASIAVEDLGESVRASNMSASTTINDQLDELGHDLKVLSMQMNSFFTHVDGGMDEILITMDWGRRELETVQAPQTTTLSTVIGNLHSALSKTGVLEGANGSATAVGRIVSDIMGQTSQQRSKATIQRTFDYLLNTLEDNIVGDLERADSLFQLFDKVDRQFHNLHRSVAKEEDSLAARKDEFLASMWMRTITNKNKLRKYEKNLRLLNNVRATTLSNKSELKSHIQVINNVKEQLDKARRNLVSPLIRGAQSNSFGLEHQVADLVDTHGFLKRLRGEQKHKVMRMLWADPKRRVTITTGGAEEIDAE